MSNEMNPYLAAMYNTHGAGEQMTEDMQKTANAELFCKLAADNGIDLSQLNDEQIANVYAQVFPEDIQKMAEGAPPPFTKKEEGEGEGKEHEKGEGKAVESAEEKAKRKAEKKEAKKEKKAAAYFEERQSFQEKQAEADWMGRIMAHSLTQERENIEIAKVASIVETAQAEGWTEDQLIEVVKEAAAKEMVGKAVEKLRGAGGAVADKARAGGKFVAEKAQAGGKYVAEKAKGVAKDVGEKRKSLMEAGEAASKKKSWVHDTKKDWDLNKAIIKGHAAHYAPHAAGVAAAGGAEEAIRRGLKGKKKESSAQAFEEIAANHAIKVAEAGGYPVEEAVEKVSAVYTLGLAESEKIAQVQDADSAVHVRGLEYLEAAGYPVNWEEIFGS